VEAPKSSRLALTDIDYIVEMTKKAEASLFDSIFLADVLGLWNDVQT
jgi:alkanesulfonate monooxygenase SsuD/methylene tetrahydromethanopterin reductase-like flavin-dependent oxidoreductase (luciferase family)